MPANIFAKISISTIGEDQTIWSDMKRYATAGIVGGMLRD